jgi:hypothetical protein
MKAMLILDEMPENCLECKMMFGTHCLITNKLVYSYFDRDKDCPLKSIKEECKHNNKAYAGFQYLTNPPQTPWICKDCGHEGKDMEMHCSFNEYEETKRRFEPVKEDEKK